MLALMSLAVSSTMWSEEGMMGPPVTEESEGNSSLPPADDVVLVVSRPGGTGRRYSIS